MFKKITFFLAISLLCSPIFAQIQLNETVITSNKYPQKQIETGKVLTVISDSVLRANSALSVGQILNQQGGVQTIGSGQTLGSTQYVSIRGSGTGLVLILLDGIPVNEPSGIGQTFDINLLSTLQIERIEILKGGQSTIYGSDAVSGVINIITKKNSGKKIQTNLNTSMGSFETYKSNLEIYGNLKKTNYQLEVGGIKSKGFSSATEPANSPKFKPNAFNTFNLGLRLRHDFNSSFSLNALAKKTDYKTFLDLNSFTDATDYYTKTNNLQLGGGAEYNVKNNKITANYLFNAVTRTYIDDSTDISQNSYYDYLFEKYKSNAHYSELYLNQKINSKLNLLLGADIRNQNMDFSGYEIINTFDQLSVKYKNAFNSILSKNAKISNSSIYGSLSGINFKNLGFEMGGRFNYHSNYKFNGTYSVTPYYLLKNKIKVFGTVSTSYRNPALYQLFSVYGNPDLKPETAQNIELGIQYWLKNTNFRMTYFDNKLKNVFYFQPINTAPFGKYINLNQQHNSGVEIEFKQDFKKINFTTNYTFLKGTFTQKANGKDSTYAYLIRRPKNAVNMNLTYRISEKWSANMNFQFFSKRNDSYFDSETYDVKKVILKAYTLINANVYYSLNSKIKFYLSAQNVANVKYSEIVGYKSRPQSFEIGLNLSL